MSKQRNIILALLGTLLALTGCSSGMTLNSNRPNSAANQSRVVVGPNGSANTANAAAFGEAVTLQFFEGSAAANGLRDTQVQRNNNDLKQIKVTLPNLGMNQSVCVITGVIYDQDRCGFGTYFTDIGEQVCLISGSSGGSLIFNLPRSDFNVVNVVLNADLSTFINWTQGTISEYAYPGMAQGKISDTLPHPACN